MSEFKLKQIGNLLWHSMMLIKSSSGCDLQFCTVEAGDYHFQLDFVKGEVTVCEAKTSFDIER